jgi:hypothetical protein
VSSPPPAVGDVRGDVGIVTAAQFRCHDQVIELAGEPALVARLLPLFVDLATDPVANAEVWTVETFQAHARVTAAGREVVPWVPLDRLAPSVISALSMHLIAADPTRLHLHAAALVDDDRTMLLLAPSGSGKSTLTCALVAPEPAIEPTRPSPSTSTDAPSPPTPSRSASRPPASPQLSGSPA